MKLQKALKESYLTRKDIQEIQLLIDMGIERKRKVKKEIKRPSNKKQLSF